MKTISLLLILGFVAAGQAGKAQKPIPSWNAPVYYEENFQESGTKPQGSKSAKGKRTMNIKAKGTDGQTPCQATVWVYSLDERDILGPYTVDCEETLPVEIDERLWGVLVQTEDHIYVDVWIDQENPLISGG
ncbi:MAG: hypothetical protein V1733_03950 [bacterium]